MSDARVVSGTRRSMKELVDGTIRVQIDIDPVNRDDFFRLFSNIDMPVALAPLVPEHARPQPPESPKSPAETVEQHLDNKMWRDFGPLAQSAILICKEPNFQEFCEHKWLTFKERPTNKNNLEEHAATYLKSWCKVSSRKELDRVDGGVERMGDLMMEYREWLQKRTVKRT